MTGAAGELAVVESTDEVAELSVDWLVLNGCGAGVELEVIGAILLSLSIV